MCSIDYMESQDSITEKPFSISKYVSRGNHPMNEAIRIAAAELLLAPDNKLKEATRWFVQEAERCYLKKLEPCHVVK